MARVPKPPMDPLGRPVEDALSAAELARLLGEASGRAGWKKADSVDLLEVWGSRTASIYRCRARDGDPDASMSDVVVKVGHGWSAKDARSLDERMRALRSRIDPAIVRIPEPLGWASDPPAVCTGYVEGTDLYFMLRDVRHPAWDSSGASATLLARCGMALAHLHLTLDDPIPEADGAIVERVRRVASSLGLRRMLPARVDLTPVIGFGDVGPHQFRIADGGTVWVLDPPMHPEPALPHEDIAMFLFGIDKLFGVDRGAAARSRRATRVLLRGAFLEGYGRAGPIDARGELDRWLIRMFETKMAAGTARRRIADREFLDAGRMLRRYGAGQLWLRRHRPRARGERP
jgi:hypothetical protein